LEADLLFFALGQEFKPFKGNFSMTSGKDDLFHLFVIPADPGSSPGGIKVDFEHLLDSGFRRNDVIIPDFLRTYF